MSDFDIGSIPRRSRAEREAADAAYREFRERMREAAAFEEVRFELARSSGPGVFVSPDCAAGKCSACTGDAWDVERDAVVPCQHDCHDR